MSRIKKITRDRKGKTLPIEKNLDFFLHIMAEVEGKEYSKLNNSEAICNLLEEQSGESGRKKLIEAVNGFLKDNSADFRNKQYGKESPFFYKFVCSIRDGMKHKWSKKDFNILVSYINKPEFEDLATDERIDNEIKSKIQNDLIGQDFWIYSKKNYTDKKGDSKSGISKGWLIFLNIGEVEYHEYEPILNDRIVYKGPFKFESINTLILEVADWEIKKRENKEWKIKKATKRIEIFSDNESSIKFGIGKISTNLNRQRNTSVVIFQKIDNKETKAKFYEIKDVNKEVHQDILWFCSKAENNIEIPSGIISLDKLGDYHLECEKLNTKGNSSLQIMDKIKEVDSLIKIDIAPSASANLNIQENVRPEIPYVTGQISDLSDLLENPDDIVYSPKSPRKLFYAIFDFLEPLLLFFSIIVHVLIKFSKFLGLSVITIIFLQFIGFAINATPGEWSKFKADLKILLINQLKEAPYFYFFLMILCIVLFSYGIVYVRQWAPPIINRILHRFYYNPIVKSQANYSV